MTATPDRLDEQDIREIFGEEVYSLPLEEAMAKGYLSPVDYRLMTDEIQLLKTIETERGRLSISHLNRKIFIPRRDEEIARIIGRNITEVDNPRTIIFCNSVKHCEHMAQFVENSFPIHSRIPEKEREVRLEMFRHGLITTVLTVDCFNEGIDIPEANVIAFLRSTDSATIFFQQLGRGLRKNDGKEKVIVLDFVANCERIRMVADLKQSVKQELEKARKGNGESAVEPMTLNMDSVEFQEKIVPILEILARANAEFYPTWQEAAVAAQKLGVSSKRDYLSSYKRDSKLPARPDTTYLDFPGWNLFFGRPTKEFYLTWEEASRAAKALGLALRDDYKNRYGLDPKLPANPKAMYEDFPGWPAFLRGMSPKNFYPTWQEASEVAVSLGICSAEQYKNPEFRQRDPRLPGKPERLYSDFPGWTVFLKREKREFYPNWQAAAEAAKKLEIKSFEEYRVRYKEDALLPLGLRRVYGDYPGDTTFFSRQTNKHYADWEEAAAAAKKLGIKSRQEYRAYYKKDPKLPSSPETKYKDFSGWGKLLGDS